MSVDSGLLLFLQGLSAAVKHNRSRVFTHVLNTHSLGEQVPPHWRLQDILRWYPGLDDKTAGLLKVAGTVIGAETGGVVYLFVSCVSCSLIPLNC